MQVLKQVLLNGAVVNFLLVLLGSVVGTLLKKGMPQKLNDAIMVGMALCVLYIGITGLFADNAKPIIIILSFAIGGVVGELIDLDRLINKLGVKIENKLKKNDDSEIAQGFVTATLLFCVGAMTIVGSIESGLLGDNNTLYSKSVIDCISGFVLASTFGIGVAFSAIPVLLIEGGLTLLATLVSPLLGNTVVSQISIIGSALIIALSLNMLKLTKIKVMNFVPAILMPIIFQFVFEVI